jgi:hypothetical protein
MIQGRVPHHRCSRAVMALRRFSFVTEGDSDALVRVGQRGSNIVERSHTRASFPDLHSSFVSHYAQLSR